MTNNTWYVRQNTRPQNWEERGACAGHPTPDLWFPMGERYDHLAITRAKEICSECPVVTECAAYSVPIPMLDGIWGGMTTEERRSLRRKTGDLRRADARSESDRIRRAAIEKQRRTDKKAKATATSAGDVTL